MMRRHKRSFILAGVLLLLLLILVVFWIWPRSLSPINLDEVAKITYSFSSNRFHRVTDRETISQIVTLCNTQKFKRYLPAYQSKLDTRDLIFWDAEGRELRRLKFYSPPAGYQKTMNSENYRVQYLQVLVTDDFLWQSYGPGIDFGLFFN